jgi:phosphoribosylformimino-5-aminoimidazole carboxamide ribotide isomerase
MGGGITPGNANEFLAAGASHVIVTSYVFRQGKLDIVRLAELVAAVGKEPLVLDLSCRKRGAEFLIVTDRWQHFTEVPVDRATLALT